MPRGHASKKTIGSLIGIDQRDIETIAEILSTYVANFHALYVKTLGCHWNIVDPRFISLHEFLEEQYKELAESTDLVAERIRQLGKKAPATLQEFKELMSIKETTHVLTGNEMLADLLSNYEHLIRRLHEDIEIASKCRDESTADILIEVLRSFEKRAWMIRSHLI